MTPDYVGPTTIACPHACDVPAGVRLELVPVPRHAWSDVAVCPYEDCERAFLVLQDSPPVETPQRVLDENTTAGEVWAWHDEDRPACKLNTLRLTPGGYGCPACGWEVLSD